MPFTGGVLVNVNKRSLRRSKALLLTTLLAATGASAQDSTLVLYDYDQIGNLISVRRTDMRSDVRHCGAPTNACADGANGSAVCVAGTCSLSCYSGYALAANKVCGSLSSPGVSVQFVPFDDYLIPVPTAPPGSYYCGGAFVSPTTDVQHCGACGNSCPGEAHGTAACRQGACTVDCASGYLLAANRVCGSVSSPGVGLGFVSFDEYLVPVPTIPAGSYYCNGAFVLPQSDPANCGACGNACPAGTTCTSGACS